MISTSLVDSELNYIKSNILNIRTDSLELKNILKSFLSRNSKLIRSITACLFLKAIDEEITDNHYKIISATEIIHNASLIHDDAIDGGLLRRGSETINSEFDNKLSVIAGDFLMSKAIDELLQLGNNDILKIFFETITKMCEGESNQYFLRNQIPTIEEYLQKTQYKTAELFKSCFVAITLFTESQMIKTSREFAINFGIAFQIKNDLDDYKLGIQNSADIKDGIYTAPIIYSKGIEDKNVYAIEQTLNLIKEYCEKAKNALSDIEESKYKQALIGIIDNLCT